MNILLVEDEQKVSRFIRKGLMESGYDVTVAGDGNEGVKAGISCSFDLIILDVVLPGMNGVEVCRAIRKADPHIPILMLTALGALDDKVTGLDAGADDYLTKPFHFQELLARIRALSRRGVSIPEPSEQIYQIEDLRIDTGAKLVTRGEKIIDLTAREFRLLELLAANQGRVLSRSVIAEKIWEHAFDKGSNVIDVYVNYLRRKIDNGHERKLIHTVIGMGYVMR